MTKAKSKGGGNKLSFELIPPKRLKVQILIRIHFKAQLSARASLTLGVCVLVGREGWHTVLSMGEEMCLSVNPLRINKKPEYLPST